MPRIPSVDEKTIAAIVREALKAESELPTLPGELPDNATMAKLGRITVEDVDQGPIKLGSTWEARPAAVVFLRHYG